MRFVLYTEKTVAQSLTALNARMQAKPSASRPALDGWVEKNGHFSIGMTCEVAGRFTRTTHLRGKLTREGGITVIRGQVSSGATGRDKRIIFGALALIGIALALSGNVWMGAILAPIGLALYIPLTGDAHNSEVLVGELQKTLKARTTPPKAGAKANGTRATSTAKPAASTRKATSRTTTRTPAATEPTLEGFGAEADV